MKYKVSWLLTLVLLLSPAAFGGDSLPTGVLSFFNLESCPEGWIPLDTADGRLVASLMPGGGNGGIVGAALSDREDRTHTHQFSASINTTDVSYVLIGGCCNDAPAKDKTYEFGGTTDAASSGLPYVQLLLCTKVVAPAPEAPEPPTGFTVYYQLFSCPTGYKQPQLTLGRFLVGLPENGSPGISFGGPSLEPQAENPHRHPFSGDVSLQSRDVAGASGCCAGGYAKAQTYNYTSVTAEDSVDLPFIQLLHCEKE